MAMRRRAANAAWHRAGAACRAPEPVRRDLDVRFVMCDSRLSFQLPVITQHLPMALPEMLGQLLGKIHRPRAPAGAADADRDIAAAFGFEARQPGVEKAHEVVAECRH